MSTNVSHFSHIHYFVTLHSGIGYMLWPVSALLITDIIFSHTINTPIRVNHLSSSFSNGYLSLCSTRLCIMSSLNMSEKKRPRSESKSSSWCETQSDMNRMDRILNQQCLGENELISQGLLWSCTFPSKDYWALVVLSERKTWFFSKLIFLYLCRCDDADILFYWTHCIFRYVYVLRITAIDGKQGLSSAKRSKTHCKSGPFVFVLWLLETERH